MRILAVEDEPHALHALQRMLEHDHEVVACAGGAEAIAALGRSPVDLVLTDLDMPPPDGFDVIRAAGAIAAPPPVVVITAIDSARAALEAMRLGASDFLLKPAAREDVLAVVGRVEDRARRREELLPPGLVGRSCALARVRKLVPLLASCRETVLIVGETGTGKELLARALHDLGPRSSGPFVAHNMAATPSELAESVFFGHVRGAFSGATGEHAGLFEQAQGGTLFLDEVDSFPFALQAKLLRVLEGGLVSRVGASAERTVDTRVVAASAIDLGELVAAGRFRADLYYRLRQLEVTMPPLRDHLEDVPDLVEHFLSERSVPARAPSRARAGSDAPRFSPSALEALMRYSWPGNCRELRNAVRSAVVLAGSGPVQLDHLPAALRRAAGCAGPGVAPTTLLAAEREQIRRALEAAGGNRSRAARLLGIDRGTLARKIRALDLDTT